MTPAPINLGELERLASWQCQRCGAAIGYVGRAIQALHIPLHRCAPPAPVNTGDASFTPITVRSYSMPRDLPMPKYEFQNPPFGSASSLRQAATVTDTQSGTKSEGRSAPPPDTTTSSGEGT